MALTATGLLEPMADDGANVRCGPRLTLSSTIVFHSPHEGHLPTHLGESIPHDEQCHTVFIFIADIGNLYFDVGIPTELLLWQQLHSEIRKFVRLEDRMVCRGVW